MSFEERAEFLFQSIESHDRQIGELTDRIALTGNQIADLRYAVDKLVAVSNEDATAIRTLARIAEAHEARISAIEENR